MNRELTDTVTFRHGAEVHNRIVMSPMCSYSGTINSKEVLGGQVTQDTLDYYQERSQAGGMIVTEYLYVSENGGPASPVGYPEQLAFFNDEYLHGLTNLASTIKKDGHKAVAQIAHDGRATAVRAARGQTVYGPSAIDFNFLDYEVTALSHQQIEKIIEDFGEATKRAIKAGFDGVEIHGANHYLLQQFFSAYSNQRKDCWGGSLAHRMRFPLAVLKKVTEVAKAYGPNNFIVGYRISPEEVHGSNVGYRYPEAKQLVAEIVNYEIDYIHLSLWGGYNSKPENSDKTYAEEFQEVLDEKTKLVIVNQVFSEEAALDAIRYADLVAVGRGIIIDPKFGLKIDEGRGNEIVSEISPRQLKKSAWPPTFTEFFSAEHNAVGSPRLPGWESIARIHQKTKEY